MPSESDDESRRTASMTRGERVRAAARTLRTPRSASWIASETDVSTKTAHKYLEQLVEDNVLRRVEQGDQTLYCIDQLMATYREIATLQREHDREELTTTLDSLQARISEWKDKYGVETPDELRASIGDIDAAAERNERQEVASEWEHLADRLPIVQAALTEYDWANKRDALSA